MRTERGRSDCRTRAHKAVRPRVFFAALCVLVSAFAASSLTPVQAQTSGEADGSGEPEASIGPITYNTGYTLNRTTANWDQDLSLDFSARGISVFTRTNGTVYSDTESKSKRRNSASNLSISYAASERLSVGLDLDISRYNDNFLRKQYNSDQVSARAVYSLPKSRGFSADLTATAGSVNDVKPTYKGSGTTSSLKLNSKYSFALPCTLQVNASGDLANRRSQDLRTEFLTRDKDVKESIDATLGVKPHKSTDIRLGFSNSNSRLQYPLSGQQETWTSASTIVNGNLDFKARGDITLTATGKYSDSDVTYDLDRTKSSTFLSKSMSTRLSVPAILGTSVSSNFDMENAHSVMGSGRNGDIKTRTLSGRIGRRLTSGISSEIVGSISLAQYFFYDVGSIGDDRDIYKDGISVGVTIGKPGSPYSGSATIKRDLEEMVYVRSMNSGNNRNAEIYSATGSFSYKRGTLTFTQIASSTLNYTLFHFSEDQNALSRTTSISSMVDFPWTKKASFKLAHTYRLQDSGRYTTVVGGGSDVYQRSGGSVTEELNLTSDYSLTSDLKVSIGQKFHQSRNFRFVSGGKKYSSPVRLLELLQNLSLSYSMGDNGSVQITVSKTLSAFGTSYWNAAAALSRTFF
ncbi:MAG: hypothetical protein NTX17_08330 [Candidatus Eisenbacteria bacterium]|nr:hypothetical protein [Candidatus Eisenbacteria bacterium]